MTIFIAYNHRTTVTKNFSAPGLIGCAPGLEYLDTPGCSSSVVSALKNM